MLVREMPVAPPSGLTARFQKWEVPSGWWVLCAVPTGIFADPQEWAAAHVGEAALGDVRRTARLEMLCAAWACRPSLSIAKLFERSYEVTAAYALLSRPEVTPDALQEGHRAMTVEALHTEGTYLLLEDTTTLSWLRAAEIPDLGPVGTQTSRHQGFLLHAVLAVRWPGSAAAGTVRPAVEILGLADQQVHVRPRQKAVEAEKESALWTQATARIGTPAAAARWVRVCDREADIYVFGRDLQQQGDGFVVRAAQDRLLVDAAGHPLEAKLLEQVRRAPSLGSLALEVQPTAKKRRPARLQLSVVPMQLRAPKQLREQRGGGTTYLPVGGSVVRVWEPHPPAGVEPLEWILLCDQAETTLAGALTCVQQYASRWLIEEFHQALQTGTRAEELQLESGHALMNAVAVKSMSATRWLHLKEMVRLHPEAPAAASGLDEVELRILEERFQRHLPTVKLVMGAIARLGGYFGSPGSKQPPGWYTLTGGLERLLDFAYGARIGLK